MEVIELPAIRRRRSCRSPPLPGARQLQANGLHAGQCVMSDEALQAIVSGHTREAGVRQFEREIARVMRSVAMRVAEDGAAAVAWVRRRWKRSWAGQVRARSGAARQRAGVATGLAWTPVGGDILFIEATRVAGSGKLILTGQLGDVMKESAQAALTLVKSTAASLNIPAAAFDAVDVHLHVPAGAIRRTAPVPASRCSSPWRRCSATVRCATTRR